ncbi:hypothetical protein [Moraxella lacunata]|uniref:hypothetical protein n=1 Tax=Moraxella lacunata TaxID=477 RepID=UPI003EE07EEF
MTLVNRSDEWWPYEFHAEPHEKRKRNHLTDNGGINIHPITSFVSESQVIANCCRQVNCRQEWT